MLLLMHVRVCLRCSQPQTMLGGCVEQHCSALRFGCYWNRSAIGVVRCREVSSSRQVLSWTTPMKLMMKVNEQQRTSVLCELCANTS